MTDHDDDRHPHQAKADEVERELDHMDERQERLGEQIEDAGEDWQSKKRDERVPGATADEDEDEATDRREDEEELDFGRDIDSEEVVGEAASDGKGSEERQEGDRHAAMLEGATPPGNGVAACQRGDGAAGVAVSSRNPSPAPSTCSFPTSSAPPGEPCISSRARTSGA